MFIRCIIYHSLLLRVYFVFIGGEEDDLYMRGHHFIKEIKPVGLQFRATMAEKEGTIKLSITPVLAVSTFVHKERAGELVAKAGHCPSFTREITPLNY